jgi:hypothetical protein
VVNLLFRYSESYVVALLATHISDADSWVLGGDINMVEHEDDCTGTPNKLSEEETRWLKQDDSQTWPR